MKVFVCNVATELRETDRSRAEDFLAAVERHVGCRLFDAVITNTRPDAARTRYWHSDVVAADWSDAHGTRLIAADMVDEANAMRHDPPKLVRAIIRAWAGRAREDPRLQAASDTHIA